MKTIGGAVYAMILIGFIALCGVMDFFPREGAPDFRYTGSDPEQVVLNLGYPLALFIYDENVRPSFVVGPLALPVIGIQILILMFLLVLPWVIWLMRRLFYRSAKR